MLQLIAMPVTDITASAFGVAFVKAAYITIANVI